MKLNIQERLLILGMQEIPRFGNLVTMRLITDLFARVGFTEKELKDGEITFENTPNGATSVRWAPGDVPVEIDITPGMAKTMMVALEGAEHISIQVVPLYDRLKDMMPAEEPKK